MYEIFFLIFALAGTTFAEDVVVTVGGNSPANVFTPPSVTAREGDRIYFNFTRGNHTVTQSTFAAPCTPIHETNVTLNGFNSGYRPAGDEQAITNLIVPVTDSATAIWFYDGATCAQGGVGAVNINATSLETLEGFRRNAIRLYGTSSTNTATQTKPAPSATSQPKPNSAKHSVFWSNGAAMTTFFLPILTSLMFL